MLVMALHHLFVGFRFNFMAPPPALTSSTRTPHGSTVGHSLRSTTGPHGCHQNAFQSDVPLWLLNCAGKHRTAPAAAALIIRTASSFPRCLLALLCCPLLCWRPCSCFVVGAVGLVLARVLPASACRVPLPVGCWCRCLDSWCPCAELGVLHLVIHGPAVCHWLSVLALCLRLCRAFRGLPPPPVSISSATSSRDSSFPSLRHHEHPPQRQTALGWGAPLWRRRSLWRQGVLPHAQCRAIGRGRCLPRAPRGQ